MDAGQRGERGDRRKLLHETIARSYPQGIPSTLTLGRWFAPEPPEPIEPTDDTDPLEALDPADTVSVTD